MGQAMTPRERILAAIDHKPVDRLPLDYWGTPEATRKLQAALGTPTEDALWARLGIDKIRYVGPTFRGPVRPPEGDMTFDYWGVAYRPVAYHGGQASYQEMCRHPLADFETIDDIEAGYQWPRADWFDFSTIPEQVGRAAGHAIEGGYIAPFYMYANIRGLEQTLVDLAADPDIAHHIIGRICEFLAAYHERLFEAAGGRIDIAQLTDDFGAQNGLLIGVPMFETFFESQYRRFAAMIRHYGARVFHHDDGAIMDILPKLDEIGIDVLNPIQWHLPGMDLERLKSGFGGRICFHGGIDNQHVLPFGTTEEVRAEVRRCVEVLASDRTGYILAPCHNVQVNTPVENVLAMYDTARACSW